MARKGRVSAGGAIFVRRDDRINMEVEGVAIVSVTPDEHRTLVERAALVLGLAVVPIDKHPLWLDDVPTFKRRGEDFVCDVFADRRIFTFHFPGDILAAGIGGAAQAYAKSVVSNVVRFRKKKRKH